MQNQYQYPYYPPQPDPTRQRLAQMEAAQYMPQYPQPPMQRPTPDFPRIVSLPVASEQEAMAVQTDFSGALQVMVDQAHGMIYTKQLSPQTGASVFGRYEFVQPEPIQPQQATPSHEQFVNREEFAKLKKDFDALFEMIAGNKEAAKHE